VAGGLKTIQDIAADVATAAGRDKEKAQKIDDGIEAVWSKIEDVVRGNDKDAYIAFEDAFESLAAAAKAGDAKKAATGSDAIAAAVKAYVAKHPAEATAGPAPAPAAGATLAARAAESAAPTPAAKPAPTPAAAAETGDATHARTGGASSALAALAGAVFALGGLAVMAGARRRGLSAGA
jgi:hypothetical protein